MGVLKARSAGCERTVQLECCVVFLLQMLSATVCHSQVIPDLFSSLVFEFYDSRYCLLLCLFEWISRDDDSPAFAYIQQIWLMCSGLFSSAISRSCDFVLVFLLPFLLLFCVFFFRLTDLLFPESLHVRPCCETLNNHRCAVLLQVGSFLPVPSV